MATPQPVMLPVDATTVVEIGDLVYLDTDDAKPASAQADQRTEAANQELFHDKFAGVAMQASRDGDTQPIRVATAGVFEFDCLSATFEVGKLIGADENAAGTRWRTRWSRQSQRRTWRSAAVPSESIRPATRVLVDVVSTVQRGGPQDAA